MFLILRINLLLLYILLCFQIWVKFPFLNGRIECPTDETSWIQRSREKCKDSNNLYHCLPTQWLNDSREECFTAERIQSGNCAIFYTDTIGYDRFSRCFGKNFTGCPDNLYLSNETYLYPSCLRINPDELCYLADKNCTPLATNNPTDATSSQGKDDKSKASQITVLCLVYSAIFIPFF